MAKKRKVKYNRIAILLLLVAIFVGGISYGIYKVFFYNPYAVYDLYNKDGKNVGVMKHTTKTKDDVYYVSVYYPEFEDKALNMVVDNYKKDNLSYKDSKDMYYINVDYDSEEIHNQYIILSFHKVVKDKDEKVLAKDTTYINYDKKNKKVLEVKDVLRRDYIEMLKQQKSDIKADSIKSENLNNFIIGKDNITFYIDEKKLSVDYETHSKYINLRNKGIPSLFQEDPIAIDEQTIDPDKPMIAFTFDDGPNAQNTANIMNEFEKQGGRATFFMLGMNAASHPDLVKQINDRGHELGNHSWDHSMRIAANKNDIMSKGEVIDEIYNTQDAIYSVCGREPNYFRPPYGALNQNVRDVSTLNFALWNVDTKDWKSKDANAVTNEVMQSAHDGAVILLHDIYGSSADAVKQFLPQLQEKGYQFVSLSTLMQYRQDALTSKDVVILSAL